MLILMGFVIALIIWGLVAHIKKDRITEQAFTYIFAGLSLVIAIYPLANSNEAIPPKTSISAESQSTQARASSEAQAENDILNKKFEDLEESYAIIEKENNNLKNKLGTQDSIETQLINRAPVSYINACWIEHNVKDSKGNIYDIAYAFEDNGSIAFKSESTKNFTATFFTPPDFEHSVAIDFWSGTNHGRYTLDKNSGAHTFFHEADDSGEIKIYVSSSKKGLICYLADPQFISVESESNP
nr:MAG TPA: hypothetical protein [Bacteriophage sp.]